MQNEIIQLSTEKANKNSSNIDTISTKGILKIINEEDKKIADAIEAVIDKISEAVDIIADKLGNFNGRLIYIGAGTSGRLGVLDASECPPTYNADPQMVMGVIAGGDYALRNAIEGSEDIEENGKKDLQDISFSKNDVLVGIAASGRTPYVIGAAKYAKSIGAKTICVACNKNSKLSEYTDIAIEAVVGPEVVTGSTRMKAGTAQKMILNMLSTTTMIKLGKTYKNYMVDLKVSNEKLRLRAINILCELANIEEKEAQNILESCNWNVKLAIVMKQGSVCKETAELALEKSNGNVERAILKIRNKEV